MQIGNSGFEYTFVPTQSGTYTIQANITGWDNDLQTDSIIINVDNIPPVWNQDLEERVILWPFRDNGIRIDLNPGAIDEHEAQLRHEIESTAFLAEDFYLDGSDLIMTSYSLRQGSFTIRAYDSEGAFVTFEVFIETVNVTFWGLVGLGSIVFLVLLILGIGLWLALNKRFMGTVYVTQFDLESYEYHEERKRTKGRGRIKLYLFDVKNSGFNNSKCYFQATGKNYIYFCADKKVYGNGIYEKKIKVDGGGYETQISMDNQGKKGIKVRFESRMKRNGY